MNLKNRGFTLVEMIATITILGVLTFISMPVISNIKGSFEQRKYEVYENTLLSAAKLYVDAYSIDVFGYDATGCSIIDFKTLLEKNLIEDIDINNASCNTENTFVRVNKNNDVYTYEVSISCMKNGKVENGYTIDGIISYEKKLTGSC